MSSAPKRSIEQQIFRGVLIGGGLVLVLFWWLVRATTRTCGGAHENVAIGQIRTMIAGQARYEDLNGYFDVPDCLAQPASCRSASLDQPPLLNETFLAETHERYHYTFHPGPPVPIERVRELELSPTSIERFAYVAVPDPGLRDQGARSFCGDSRGLICELEGGASPKVERGQCVLAEDPKEGCVILGR